MLSQARNLVNVRDTPCKGIAQGGVLGSSDMDPSLVGGETVVAMVAVVAEAVIYFRFLMGAIMGMTVVGLDAPAAVVVPTLVSVPDATMKFPVMVSMMLVLDLVMVVILTASMRGEESTVILVAIISPRVNLVAAAAAVVVLFLLLSLLSLLLVATAVAVVAKAIAPTLEPVDLFMVDGGNTPSKSVARIRGGIKGGEANSSKGTLGREAGWRRGIKSVKLLTRRGSVVIN